ncbi:YciI family protein [Actinospongicola halichondriae]|uniref:YciI family protein n=1 Tax=Actinospongicola halichondriae TaxID=3236844 RepID=UPI003D4E345A
MPQFMLSVCHDDDYADADWSDPEMQRIGGQVGAVNEEMESTGVWVFGAGLQPQSTATVVRVTDGDVSMTDGPFAETKEQMGGFWVIEVPDLDTALEWTAKCAAACEAPVELRPMQTE